MDLPLYRAAYIAAEELKTTKPFLPSLAMNLKLTILLVRCREIRFEIQDEDGTPSGLTMERRAGDNRK